MAKVYAAAFIGVVDKTKTPPDRADGRLVGASIRKTVAAKPAGVALASGDLFYIGRKRPGETIRAISVIASASLATSTLSIGTEALPSKYAAARTMTVVDTPTFIGPNATTADDVPSDDYEDIWATVGVAAIAAGTSLTIELEIAGSN